METERKIKTLQMFYSAALADAVFRMGNEGILQKVTDQKKSEQMLSGKARAQQLGIAKAEQVFEVLPEIFECADWKITPDANGFAAEARSCMLCGMAKKMGAQSPCNLYCLDAMEGLVKGVEPDAHYQVESTLWNAEQCRVSVKTH